MIKGKYIMFEGSEGGGKTTQARLLYNFFREKNYEPLLVREPGTTKEAEAVRQILLNKGNGFNLSPLEELLLFETARSSIHRQKIIPALEQGRIVIQDRGWPSTTAYQGYAGETSLETINYLNSLATQGLLPNKLFIIDIDPMVGLEKEQESTSFSEKGMEFHKKVREGYLKIAKQHPKISAIIPYLPGKQKVMHRQIVGILQKELIFSQ